MARLKVTLRGAQISDVHLDPSREYLAGRKETCDILLQPERGISREHFRLKFSDGGWVAQSMSRFGEIFAGGDRVEKVALEHGLIFQVPPYEFQFRDLPEEEARESSVNAQPVIGENDRTVVGVAQQVPFIKMMSSDGQIREMLRLESGEVWVAGRDPSCQIIIPDQRVSRKQYEIRKLNGAFTIIDLNSVNGTFLNGSPISSVDPHTLKSGDSLSVLDNIMYFELHDPNFKYKVDKIDVPPLAFSDKELSLNPEEFSGFTDSKVEPSQEASQSNLSQQQGQQGSSPLMVQQVSESYAENAQAQQNARFQQNQQNQNSSQYYQFTPNQANAVPPETPWEKFKKNKPLMAAAILIFLGGAFYISEEMSKDELSPIAIQEPATQDPFSQLTPEQQKTVKDLLSLAQKAMLQNKYSFAIENLKKLHELLPVGYQDSKGMLEEATLNEQIISQKLEQERLDAEKAQQQIEIQNTVAKCEKEIKPDITVEKMRECLAPASLIDAEHPEVTRLLSEAERIATEREIEKQRRENEQQQAKVVVEVDHLKEKFELAEKYQAAGRARRAIRSYNEVINSEHKDLKEYKKKSQERIDFILKKIQEKVDSIVQQAEVPLKDGKLKEGIEILRQALDLDPMNDELNSRVNLHMNELKNQVKILYQESIIDENFGNLDGDDVRQGAKQKWKKILELDVDDGEYYRKAYTKLKRYGVF